MNKRKLLILALLFVSAILGVVQAEECPSFLGGNTPYACVNLGGCENIFKHCMQEVCRPSPCYNQSTMHCFYGYPCPQCYINAEGCL